MKDQHQARQVAKKAFEDQLATLKRQAALAGFEIDGEVVDPVEDAVAHESMLIDARTMLTKMFQENVELANSLGYNVRIDRKLNPLPPCLPSIEVHIWPQRNADGGYDG